MFAMMSFTFCYGLGWLRNATSWTANSASSVGSGSAHHTKKKVPTRLHLLLQIRDHLLFRVQFLLVLRHEALVDNQNSNVVRIRIVPRMKEDDGDYDTISWMRDCSTWTSTLRYSSSESKLSTRESLLTRKPRTTGPFNRPSMSHSLQATLPSWYSTFM